jgi:light-regulated signal transduction histidine kinase (bacteriophytochrome)
MPIGELQDLRACDREPIHIPGSIQPRGVLLFVDQTSDFILQATANSTRLIAFSASVIGQTLEHVVGVSLAALLQRAETVLLGERIFLGTVSQPPPSWRPSSSWRFPGRLKKECCCPG